MSELEGSMLDIGAIKLMENSYANRLNCNEDTCSMSIMETLEKGVKYVQS